MFFRPFHDGTQFLPVVDLLIGQVLHRGSGDDHAVVTKILDFIVGFIKIQQMLSRRILGHMCGSLEQIHLHLEGTVA